MAQFCRAAPRPLGLAPTMGALHAGHLSLVAQARADNRTAAVSIFVNPTQFGPGEDFEQYPRDLEADLRLLQARGVDVVYAPAAAEVYPPGFDTWVAVGPLADRVEGAHRPGHFRGVATVVLKLFNTLRPDRAYFGQKDGQQVAVVRKFARDLDTGVEIVVLPTIREPDGLAMSSRNIRLNPPEREAAAVVYRALGAGYALWRGGERRAETIRAAARQTLQAEPRLNGIDYLSLADADTLEELETAAGRAMLSTAVHLGSVRLIDNLLLE